MACGVKKPENAMYSLSLCASLVKRIWPAEKLVVILVGCNGSVISQTCALPSVVDITNSTAPDPTLFQSRNPNCFPAASARLRRQKNSNQLSQPWLLKLPGT